MGFFAGRAPQNEPVLDGVEAAQLLSFVDVSAGDPLFSVPAELRSVRRDQEVVGRLTLLSLSLLEY